MKIFINAGHGGADSGAVSKKGLKEKEINRIVSSFLAGLLIEDGYNIEFYQQEKSVNQVVEAEKKSGASLVISIHCNSSTNPLAKGVEVLHYPNSGTGKRVAELVCEEITKDLEITNRGAKARNDLRILSGTNAPAVLVELAFLSNPDEEKLLEKEFYLFANAIAKGIKKWQ